ncbi:hypothetical protein [Halorussus marinus]|uniref:hypothetical protein n=1 Tax=Halorussus marinus TaxID=2505976 RepID=UPI001ADA9A7B|nr:hypothetical protein [Halorussus marinus]
MADQPDVEADARPRTDDSRSLIRGSFRTAFAETDSRLLQSYAVVAALLSALLATFVVLALPVWIFATVGGSEFATFSRAFLIVGGALLLAVLIGPVLSTARKHRRGTASARADLLAALAGYLFVASLYVSLLISAPPDAREAPPALLAPAVEFLYALPAVYALAPPALGIAAILAVHRLAR